MKKDKSIQEQLLFHGITFLSMGKNNDFIFLKCNRNVLNLGKTENRSLKDKIF